MTETLSTLKAIANHLTRKGGEVMIAMGRATLRARIGDHLAGVTIHFRRSGIVRITIGLSARGYDVQRGTLAGADPLGSKEQPVCEVRAPASVGGSVRDPALAWQPPVHITARSGS